MGLVIKIPQQLNRKNFQKISINLLTNGKICGIILTQKENQNKKLMFCRKLLYIPEAFASNLPLYKISSSLRWRQPIRLHSIFFIFFLPVKTGDFRGSPLHSCQVSIRNFSLLTLTNNISYCKLNIYHGFC